MLEAFQERVQFFWSLWRGPNLFFNDFYEFQLQNGSRNGSPNGPKIDPEPSWPLGRAPGRPKIPPGPHFGMTFNDFREILEEFWLDFNRKLERFYTSFDRRYESKIPNLNDLNIILMWNLNGKPNTEKHKLGDISKHALTSSGAAAYAKRTGIRHSALGHWRGVFGGEKDRPSLRFHFAHCV